MTNVNQNNEISTGQSSKDYIGTAHMDEDGTIELRLRMEDAKLIGEGVLKYPKQHPDYTIIFSHLNGLSPGEYKTVPPWTNDK